MGNEADFSRAFGFEVSNWNLKQDGAANIQIRGTMNKGNQIAKSYDLLEKDICDLLEKARRQAARSVNAVLTATYWKIGKRIVEHEQKGKERAEYGESLLKNLSLSLTVKFGRGFSFSNLKYMKQFYLVKKSQTLSGLSDLADIYKAFPLSWSHYVLLMGRTDNDAAYEFYETLSIQGGWSVRQLYRQINSQFYQRTLLSRNKAAMLDKGDKRKPSDKITPEEEIKDPYVLEFLGLKDEYSESQLEESLILHMENFLLELGGDFTFVARQKRLRIGDSWFRVDLVFYHRRLRCLVLVDLKIGEFSHADAGQMHMYLNYAKAHWTHPEENPPVGLILCEKSNQAVAKYALDGLPNKVMAAKYSTLLPAEAQLVDEMVRTKKILEGRPSSGKK